MAYSITGLQPIGGQSKAGNAPQMWSYTSADALATVNTTGYFNSVADLLKVGDLIYRPNTCLLYTSPSPRDGLLSRMPSSA